MSATYKCSKCGAEMFSKCRLSRSEFMRDLELAMLEKVLYPVKFEKDKGPEDPTEWQKKHFKPNYCDVTFRIWLPELSKGEMLKALFDTVRSVPEERMTQVLCIHDWVCLSDCIFGCCKAVPQEDLAK